MAEEADLKDINDPKTVVEMMDNAQRLKNNELWKKCFSHLCKLRADGHQSTSAVVNGYYKFLYAYEQALTEKNNKTTRANRIRRMVANRVELHGSEEEGIVAAIGELAVKKGHSQGFQYLMISGQGFLTAEHLVEKNPDQFSEEIVTAATEKIYGWDPSMADPEIVKMYKRRWG